MPPNGAVYLASVHMPIIGEQTFVLTVVSRTHARILLRGRALNLDEPAEYREEQTDEKRGRTTLRMLFNEPTQALLARWRTRESAEL
eukprot:6363015-Prymnesium_polylepis.1